VSRFDVLVNRFLDDRSELAPDELDKLIAGLRAEPARAAALREHLIVDDLLAQKLTVDRRNFLAQVEQRIADFERSEDEIDNQVAELRELATTQFERPSRWSGHSTWVKAALALSLAAVVAGFIVVPRWLPEPRRPVARVVTIRGAVIATEHEAATPLAESATLFTGQQIETPSDSSLTLEYDDKTQIRVTGGSLVSLGALRGSGAKRIHIARGEVWADVAKQSAGAMEFLTPHAIAVVLGTELRLTVTSDDTLLEVSAGLVRLDRLDRQDSIDVAASQTGLATDANLDLRDVSWPASTEGLAYALDPFVRRVPRARNPASRQWYSSPLEVVGSAAVNEFNDALELTGGYFRSRDDGADIVTVSQESSEFSLELIYRPAAKQSAEPGRVVALESDNGRSNFALSQAEDDWSLLLRTDSADEASPFTVQIPRPDHAVQPTYLVITYRDGELAAYRDGMVIHRSQARRGTLAAWKPATLLIGANSRGGDSWRGTIEALAIYHRCLTADEVARNVRNYRQLAARQP